MPTSVNAGEVPTSSQQISRKKEESSQSLFNEKANFFL